MVLVITHQLIMCIIINIKQMYVVCVCVDGTALHHPIMLCHQHCTVSTQDCRTELPLTKANHSTLSFATHSKLIIGINAKHRLHTLLVWIVIY